jgi:sulfatase modifying factor 1
MKYLSCTFTFSCLLWISVVSFVSAAVSADIDADIDIDMDSIADDLIQAGANLEPHPDPNDEEYAGMIYMGRHDHETGRRLGHDVDNSIKYLFGTSFDDAHKDILEQDLQHEHYGPDSQHDIADAERTAREGTPKTRQEALKERRHKKIDQQGPKPFGHVDINPLDGGPTPVKVVKVEPYFLDVALVTNKEFAKFVQSTYYETEAEKFGWSFVLASFVADTDTLEQSQVDPEAEDWVVVNDAYWRRPEGPDSSYKYREHHPVIHISHRDAAEYCKWLGKRLPGEREWEAAARAGHWGPKNRTLYVWGNGHDDSDNSDGTDDVDAANVNATSAADWAIASRHANLWGTGKFPWENTAADGWRGTSPVRTYPANAHGFYDMTGNVWEWMRGGKHKARIVRGGSYVDSLDGSYNHAATLGARSTLHGTTTTGNVGFRCAKSPKRRTEHHWQWHDDETHGQLGIEDEFGRLDMVPQRGWEDQFNPDEDDDDVDEDELPPEQRKPKKRKVVKKREVLSTEL